MLGNLVVVPHAGSIDSLSRQTSSFRVSSIRLGAPCDVFPPGT